MSGKVYWITGLSGAGKTTIGTILYHKLKKNGENVVLLDGDTLRRIIGGELGFSYEDRLEKGKRYSDMCRVLSSQGLTVICCTIAMFDEVRKLNRDTIKNYYEIFLNVSTETLYERDQNKIYSGVKEGRISGVMGIDIKAEFPKNPDIVIENDNGKEIYSLVENILKLDSKELENEIDENEESIYEKSYDEVSRFALESLVKMEKGKKIICLGKNSEIDGGYFHENGLNSTILSKNSGKIESLLKKFKGTNLVAIEDEYSESLSIFYGQYDYIYSRAYFKYAIKDDSLLIDSYRALKPNGKMFIEILNLENQEISHDEILDLFMKQNFKIEEVLKSDDKFNIIMKKVM